MFGWNSNWKSFKKKLLDKHKPKIDSCCFRVLKFIHDFEFFSIPVDFYDSLMSTSEWSREIIPIYTQFFIDLSKLKLELKNHVKPNILHSVKKLVEYECALTILQGEKKYVEYISINYELYRDMLLIFSPSINNIFSVLYADELTKYCKLICNQ
jgi:hypothetical protein